MKKQVITSASHADMHGLYSQDGIYSKLDYIGLYPCRAIIHTTWLMMNQFPKDKKHLIIGAGLGWELVYMRKKGYNIIGADLYVPDVEMVKEVSIRCSADQLPFKDNEFHTVICTETMEHIPEELTDDILEEVKRVGKEFYFTIATKDDAPFYTHVNIHSGTWWIEKFLEHGFEILNAQINPLINMFLAKGNKPMIKTVNYDDGVMVWSRK